MSSKDVIPPSPTQCDYTQDPAYQASLKANEVDIFGRDNPFELFSEWMEQARAAEPNDSNAMALATVDANGLPDVRMVLLKGMDERGFCFYTNNDSAKGQQLAALSESGGGAALCFHWKSLRRQVRVRGAVSRVSQAEADAYFASRARGSQIGAWSSDQSRPVEDRAQLETKVAQAEARFEGKDIPRPPFWSGWRVAPQTIEFWRDRRYRLHDRLLFSRAQEMSGTDELAIWDKARLYP